MTIDLLKDVSPFAITGRVSGAAGLQVIVQGIDSAVGTIVHIGEGRVPAEVVAIRDGESVVMALGQTQGLALGDVVEAGTPPMLTVGESLRGRVVDSMAKPIDGGPALPGELHVVAADQVVPNPMNRQRIADPLGLGVRAVDAMLPCGQGQRIGIFAGSGVGKSSLLAMMARGTQADVTVVALVGERGREVREFIEDELGPDGMANAVVVVATSDEPAPNRLRAAFTATRIAEWFASTDRNVLLLMDSVTRVATAQREIGLTAGEPPTTRGYPPSVFAMLPRLLERTGPLEVGSITGVYTVLVEGDDLNEPITDHVRSILDGHIVLDRALAAEGHFPTIDILNSVSRLASKVSEQDHTDDMIAVRRLLLAWDTGRDLVELGAYQAGSNPELDAYLTLRKPISVFLRQSLGEHVARERSLTELKALADAIRTLSGETS